MGGEAAPPNSVSGGATSLRTLLGIVLVGSVVYGGVVFGGFALLAADRAAQLREAIEPLEEELRRVSAIESTLDSLVARALALNPGDTAGARALADTVSNLPIQALAIQRDLPLPERIRTTLAELPALESDVAVRARILTAAVEVGTAGDYVAAREALLTSRATLGSLVRRVDLEALEYLADREASLDRQLTLAQRFLAVAAALGLLLGILAFRILDGRLLSPLEELRSAVEGVGSGDLSRRIEPRHPDEMGRLAELFNEMTQTLLRRQQEESAVRQAMSTELRRRENLFQEVVSQAQELILVMDRDGKILFAGSAWRSLTGVPAEAMGVRFPDVVPGPASRSIRAALAEAAAGLSVQIQVPLDRGEEGPGVFDVRFTPLSGDRDRILAIGRDVTETLAEEERLRRSSRMEAVGQLTGGVAHDFNNLLTVIQGNLDLLGELAEDATEERQRLLATLEHAADRAAGLTQSLLAFSRRQTLQSTHEELGAAVRKTVTLLDRVLTEEIELLIHTPDEPIPVELDVSQLDSAIMNLCLNARDAMPRGGQIRISVQESFFSHSEAAAADLRPGPYASVSVQDTGEGMSQEIMAKAMEPFFTTKEVGKGSGLGLSMAYGFARQSGGTLRLSSTPGAGTTATLLFPLAGTPRNGDEADAASAGATLAADRGKEILVVEDDPAVRDIVVEMLRDLGYTTREAVTGREAMNLLQDGLPDMVLSDVVLPGGQDGAQLARDIKGRHPELPVLLMSGYPREALAHREGMKEVEILSKPYNRESLGRAVARALRADREDAGEGVSRPG